MKNHPKSPHKSRDRRDRTRPDDGVAWFSPDPELFITLVEK
jgi:hypothetical protein